MKKTILFLLAVLLAAVAAARPVDSATARRVAEVYLQAQGMRNTAALVDVTAETPFTEFYVFAAPEGGFILVSGDDCVVPVLGFSTESQFSTKDIPENVRGWLEDYEREIRWWREQEPGNQESEAASQWALLEAGEVPTPPLMSAVSPLLATTWAQDPYYNNLCPYHSASGERSVAGCVATATAQIMKYHNYPATGYGSHTYTSDRTVNGVNYYFPNLSANFGNTTYQWSSMPNYLTGASSTTQVNAVATLMYHVGVAVEMAYSPLVSSASNYYEGLVEPSSQAALVEYFKYRPDIYPIARDDYSTTAYASLLQAELNQSRPILYSGRHTSGGHSFVLDGYNNNGQFHINWGWGGYHDGYFVIGSLNPGTGGTGGNSSGTYNMNNLALLGIQPNTNWSTTGSTVIAVTSSGNGTVSGGGSYSFGDVAQLVATPSAGYRFCGWSDGSKFNPREIIATGGSYTFTANFEPVTGDTLHYCPGNFFVGSYSAVNSNTTVWGVKLPSSLLASGSPLTAVQLFVHSAGTYNLTVYTGAGHSTVAATSSVYFSQSSENQWQTITLGTPVATTDDIWIIFSSTADYPATYTYGSGVASAFLWTDSFYEDGISWGLTAMIKGIFGSGTMPPPAPCDTIATFPYTQSFDNNLDCWTAVDNNNDDFTWSILAGDNTTFVPHSGTGMAISFSWNDTPMQADEYLISPLVELPAGQSATLSWWFKVNGSYPLDKLALKLSTTGNAVGNFTTTLIDITPTAANDSWTQQTVDLSAYAGQSIYLAFHHHDSYDANFIVLDDIQISTGSAPPTQYTITVTSNNPAWGTVSGGGTYSSGATATLVATANSGYHFVQWQDGNTSATRSVTVTGNATYTATFAVDSPGPVNNDCVITSFPYSEDFDGEQIYCWNTYDMDNDVDNTNYTNAWFFFSSIGYNNSDAAAIGNNNGDNYSGDYLMSPVVITPGTYTATWKARTYEDATLYYYVMGYNWTDMAPMDGYRLDSITGTNWVTKSFVFTVAQGDSVRLAFDYVTTGGSFLIIDNVTISQGGTPQYTITVNSNNPAWGTVSGSGTYNAGATATLSASANSGYRFVQWQDGNTNATRTVTVTGNATYTATFAPNNGVDDVETDGIALYPNPAREKVTLEGLTEPATVTLVDLHGRELDSRQLPAGQSTLDISALPDGVYFLRIVTARTTATRRLVVE